VCGHQERSEFIGSLELVDPRCGEVLAPSLFGDGPRDAVRIGVESTWSMFDLIVELSQRLDPSSKNIFRPLECLQPLNIGAEDLHASQASSAESAGEHL